MYDISQPAIGSEHLRPDPAVQVASSSRSQLAMRTARAAVSLTWGSVVRRRPLVSVVDGDDRYSPGYSVLLHAGSSPDHQLGNWLVMLLLTCMLQIRRHLRLSMSARGIPLLVLPSGTQRARR
jgi:hypothetical protein